MDQSKLDEILAKHELWLNSARGGERANLTEANLTDANLTDTNLTRANLTEANLIGANLTRADLDYASFPLWCGGAHFKASPSLLWQFLAHAYTLIIDDPDAKEAQAAILKYARKSHRADDLKIPREED